MHTMAREEHAPAPAPRSPGSTLVRVNWAALLVALLVAAPVAVAWFTIRGYIYATVWQESYLPPQCASTILGEGQTYSDAHNAKDAYTKTRWTSVFNLMILLLWLCPVTVCSVSARVSFPSEDPPFEAVASLTSVFLLISFFAGLIHWAFADGCMLAHSDAYQYVYWPAVSGFYLVYGLLVMLIASVLCSLFLTVEDVPEKE